MAHPLEFTGMISHRPQSEIHPPSGPVIDPDYIRRFAQAHEAAGFDRILVSWGSTAPDALLVAGQAAAATSRIGFMVAHRPGFIAPTVAARQFATFDHLSGGRAAIHVISGGSTTEQQKVRIDALQGELRELVDAQHAAEHRLAEAEATAAERERLEASLAEAEHQFAAEAAALAGARNELVRTTADRDAIAKQADADASLRATLEGRIAALDEQAHVVAQRRDRDARLGRQPRGRDRLEQADPAEQREEL